MASRNDGDIAVILSGRESNGDVEMKHRNGLHAQEEGDARGAAPAKSSGLDSGWAWVVVLGSFIIHHNVLGVQYSFGVLFKV